MTINCTDGTATVAVADNRRTQRYLTTAEVGELLRVPSETIRYWRHVGTGPKSFKIGRRVLYAVEDVESFVASARAECA